MKDFATVKKLALSLLCLEENICLERYVYTYIGRNAYFPRAQLLGVFGERVRQY